MSEVQAISFDVGSGDLLIHEWFAIRQINDVLEPIERKFMSGGNRHIERTKAILAETGVLTMYVSNQAKPQVYEVPEGIVIGEGAGPGTKVGLNLNGDTSCVMIAPRDKLVALVARKLGHEEAERRVASYLEDLKDYVIRVKAEPGLWTVYATNNPMEFADAFSSPDVPMTGDFKPYFVAARTALELDEAPSPAPAGV